MRTMVLSFLLLFGASAAQAQSAGKRLAVVNGEVITEEQVLKAATQQLTDIELRQLQFDAGIRRDRSSAIEDTLEEIVADKLLDAEAGKRKVSREELMNVEVLEKVPVPSDEAVNNFWVANQANIQMTREQALPQIRAYLRQEERERTRVALIERLKKEYGAESFFEPLRTELSVQGHPVSGPAQAPITIVEFSDFECPYCGALFPTLKKIEADYKDKIRIVYRQYPLAKIHPNAWKAAEASLCANEQQQFWALHDAMFSDQRNLSVDALKQKAVQLKMNPEQFNACLDSGKYLNAVQQDVVEGTKLGVSGTPAMFVNGRFLSGAQPYDEIAKVIEDELRRLGLKK